jgi:hypothetical protein
LLRTSRILLPAGSRSLQDLTVDLNSSSEWLGAACKRRAKITNFVINVSGVFDRLRDFSAQETSVTLSHVVQLLFYGGFGDSKLRGEIGI